MDSRILQVVDQLMLIERELMVLGWWDAQAPSVEALSSREPFCVDTLSFEQWLQWIFLPRMKQMIEQGESLPKVSGIREMGDMAFMDRLPEANRLLGLLGAFDRLISGS